MHAGHILIERFAELCRRQQRRQRCELQRLESGKQWRLRECGEVAKAGGERLLRIDAANAGSLLLGLLQIIVAAERRLIAESGSVGVVVGLMATVRGVCGAVDATLTVTHLSGAGRDGYSARIWDWSIDIE